MPRVLLLRRVRISSWMIVIALLATSLLRAGETALDRYVAKPDPTYSWKVVRTVQGNPLTQYVVDLKSQTWRTEKEVDRTGWQHWLTVVKPAQVNSKMAFRRDTGGGNRRRGAKGGGAA